MANTVLVGAQWGDEGKGKVIDVLTKEADWVVRFQGGSNAGHTVIVEGQKYVLHLVPSGILHAGKRCVIGHGVVVDPVELVKELDGVVAAGHAVDGRFHLSDRAHLVLPPHRLFDAGREARLGAGGKIGTTGRGIGPTYTDKAMRTGLRAGSLLDPNLPELLRARFAEAHAALAGLGYANFDVEAAVKDVTAAAKRLAPFICDTLSLLHEGWRRGEALLFEGAQGTMLDIDMGTYPFVTSSSCTAGGACTGTGMPPRAVDRVIGVLKAYTTRVGEGPFPTELNDATGEELRRIGGEYGATTGRPRRCGWFDAVVARHAARVNGVDGWAVTKLDVLGTFPTLRLCTAYRLDGRVVDAIPACPHAFARCEPVYEEMPGWMSDVSKVRSMDQLPPKALAYLRRMEELTGVRTAILSVGAGRESTLRIF